MRHLLFPAALVSAAPVALALFAMPAGAQGLTMIQPLNTDADRLGTVMRELATSPNNVEALVTAGELSLKLDDLRAAAAFFARVEKVDPRNARMKAGEATILVRSERPGEALRYFAMAESLGLSPRAFAGDRALAYDLIGEQGRAQRDYRLALTQGADEEIQRRYALSLGISGNQALALQQIDSQVRKQDRGAWRARAFILAMTGDQAGATKIATTMMPGALGSGLQPFFERLPTLPAADRAFAVHFGEVRPTPERLADARLVPTLPALGPDPTAPVMMAATTPPPAVQTAAIADRKPKRGREKSRNDRSAGRSVQLAAASTAAPVPVAGRVALPTTTPQRVTLAASPMQSVQSVAAAPVPIVTPGSPVASTSALTAAARPGWTVTTMTALPAPGIANRPLGPGFAGTTASGVVNTAPVTASSPTRGGATMQPQADGTLSARTVAQMAAIPVGSAAPVAALPVVTTPVETARPGFASIAPAAPIQNTTQALPSVPSPAPRAPDSILARIVAGLSVPMADLKVDPLAQSEPAPAVVAATPAPATATPPRAKVEAKPVPPVREVVAPARTTRPARAKAMAATITPEPVETPVASTRLSRRQAARAAAAAAKDNTEADAATETAALTTKATKKTAKPTAAEKKALADKKAAADKKALADKQAAEEKKLAKADPERIWVQVAGGANASDLPKAWSSVQGKAAALKGRPAYATPLRATNRVVTGPFKTDAEARAFVNTLAKQGVSAFTFTSNKGQKLTKLPAK